MQLLTARDDPHGTVGENSIEKTGNKTTNIPPFLQLVTTVTKNKLSFRKGNGEFFFLVGKKQWKVQWIFKSE